MDKNSIIGLVVIGALLVGYMLITKPSKEELAETKRKQDSIAQVEKEKDSIRKAEELALAQQKDSLESIESVNSDSIIAEIPDSISQEDKDSIQELALVSEYGIFKDAATGTEEFFTIENEKMIITLTNKGGKIYSVELKDYKTYYGDPLILFTQDSTAVFGLEMLAQGKALITNDMYFVPTNNSKNIKVGSESVQAGMRLEVNENKYIEFLYTVKPDDYMIDFDINIVGLQEELRSNPYITLRWNHLIPGLERGRDWESNSTTAMIRMSDEDVEKLSERKDEDSFESKGSAQWVACKQQFFSSILIAQNKLDNPTVKIAKIEDENSKYLKSFESEFTLSLTNQEKENQKFNFYFGPNKFSTLKQYDLKLEKVVPLGWGIFGWVNRFLIIPIFNWLGGFINNFGLIILLLTLIIKIGLFPLTYKSYMSSAKMRVLKPQIDELGKKYGKDKAMEKQQATMALYKKAGASPMGGCLPMLLQFPILIAMFRFFPASIELRQQSFLWANDLSSYDAIVEWSGNIPLITKFYGNHISLFTLLMAASMLISTRMTSANQQTNNNMPGMKQMMYIMPVMMIFWFNKYSSGLSYYYFLANLITILQTFIIQKFIIDEKKVLAQMEANKKKPPKPKSKWQQRLEEAQKMQQKQMRNKR
ncbi:MAG: membrane protein insertase YidC [Marinilabiliales bacterium]|nr:MAG: membrane protein insertase YidC [Marinilabiliales bacterium]